MVIFLSTAYDWINASPHGASVVPNDAAKATHPSRLTGRRGTSAPENTSDHTGPARTPFTTYSANVAEMANSTRSTRTNEPSTTTRVISVPAAIALIHEGSPINEPAAATPAYSAQMVPKLAKSSASTAAYPQRCPQRSRTTATKPFPVAAPRRTATRWNCTNSTVEAGMIQSNR